MTNSRRRFLKDSAAAGVALGVFGIPASATAQGGSTIRRPTARAEAFMSLWGLKYPIVQAPSGGAELAAAISNAGALGHIALWGGAQTDAAAVTAVKSLRGQTTRPFVANYVLTFEPRSLGAALDAGVPVVQFSWGIPARESVRAIGKAGAKFGVQVGTAIAARAAVDAGATYLVAQGNEAGGHVQSSTPLAELLPLVLKEAGSLPVLVAGGITTGQRLRAALIAGASGAIMGTRFMATQESSAHDDYKSALVHAQAADAAMSVCYGDGWPGATHRTLRNGTLNRWEAAGCPPPGQRPGEGDIVARRANSGGVMRYSIATPSRGLEGTVTDMAMYAGQGVGEVKDVPPVRDLLARIWAECVG
jgi:nitronate monooxygenase